LYSETNNTGYRTGTPYSFVTPQCNSLTQIQSLLREQTTLTKREQGTEFPVEDTEFSSLICDKRILLKEEFILFDTS
jgi:hypothetical protein